ncbi:MAG: hypothetical protein JXQ87_09235 [Bacteroidia bacterium]
MQNQAIAIYLRNGYRYGFNGKEQDPEWNGSGNMYDYGFRIYDPRIAKFLSIDPLTSSFPYLTPYQYASNCPVSCIDIDGLEAIITVHSKWWGKRLALEYTKAQETGDFSEFRRLAHKVVMDVPKDKWQHNEFVKNGNKNGLPASFDINRDQNPPGITLIIDGKEYYDPMNDVISNQEQSSSGSPESDNWLKRIGRYIDGILFGDHAEEPKTREASPYEQWLHDNVDQQELERMKDILGNGAFGGDMDNFLELEPNPENVEVKEVQTEDEGVSIDDFGNVKQNKPPDSSAVKFYINDSTYKYYMIPVTPEGAHWSGEENRRPITEQEYNEYIENESKK